MDGNKLDFKPLLARISKILPLSVLTDDKAFECVK
jgi:hypothetical protein